MVVHAADAGAQLAAGLESVRALEVGLHVPGPAAGEGPQRADGRAVRRTGSRTVPLSSQRPADTQLEENVTLLAAFGAGLLSFISPCVLPLIPGYLSYISGLSLDEMRGTPRAERSSPSSHRRTYGDACILSSLAFILGFSLVFVALGASASASSGSS